MSKIIRKLWLLAAMSILVAVGCKKKDSVPSTVATLTTASITNITATSATSGGTISGNGGETITASGVAWSKTNTLPTIADDTTKGTTTSGSFVSELKNLDPSATYYVRAYATNSVGTGYGNVQTFGSGNAAPEARNVNITGTKEVAAVLTANYTYFDAEGNPESATAFQWYIANDTIGAAVTPITGATANTYTVVSANLTRFLKVGVTPKSSAGTSPGIEAKSYWVGPIGAESVTFTYMGQSVTYGVITSSITGRKWMDRNLGASRAATGYRDWLAYGHLFQWGRLDDGHQKVTWDGERHTVSGGNSTVTTTISTTDVPGHSSYISETPTTLGDWRSPQNPNLWQAASGQINNPCPPGWHIPTDAEWDAEIAGTENVADVLKLTTGQRREFQNGNVMVPGSTATSDLGHYWSSTTGTGGVSTFSWYYRMTANNVLSSDLKKYDIQYRGMGYSCRCIKD